MRARLGQAPAASFAVADLLDWQPARRYGAWHDRAVFHFLVAPDQQRRYVETAAGAPSSTSWPMTARRAAPGS